MKDFFTDDERRLSCMRLLCFLVVLAVLGVWLWGNAVAGQYVPLGYAEAGLIGPACGGKAAQGYFASGRPGRFEP